MHQQQQQKKQKDIFSKEFGILSIIIEPSQVQLISFFNTSMDIITKYQI